MSIPQSRTCPHLEVLVGTKVIESNNRPSTKENVDLLTDVFAEGIAYIRPHHANFLVGFPYEE